ncbi:MAG: aconitate hydratase AcnA [Desulfobacterales bacterium]|nr:aconitate hydratase AcnA [Desulfobacterales bacterium]
MKSRDFVKRITLKSKNYHLYDIKALHKKGIADVNRLPFTIKILVENLLRKLDGRIVKEEDLVNIARWQKTYSEPVEIPFHPARVMMHDYTGAPAIVDLAAMRDAVKALGGDPKIVNPLIPVEFIVDHSIQVDHFGTADALDKNVEREYQRNGERYALLKWAQKSFDNFKVVPPKAGICHQVNLEYLGRVVISETVSRKTLLYPDTMICTDSHTPMINGIGVIGVGVGGIEAEAVMLGQPYYMAIPEVIGVRLTGSLKEGVTATDLVLTVTHMLRKHKVVEKYVEYFGPGIKNLTVPDRATVANMTPEYGATLGFFPVDAKTIEYLKLTNREKQATVAARCLKAQGLFYSDKIEPEYTQVLELDLGTVEPCVAGPSRPQDRIILKDLKGSFANVLGCEYERDTSAGQLSTFIDESGCQTVRAKTCKPINPRLYEVNISGNEEKIGDGSIVIAAITSCTNTSNPHVMIGAGLIAKNAVEKGLRVPPCVKTSLAPGSKVVIRYLTDAGLMPYLEALGFHVAGFGCTTCIGNSGPLHQEIERVVKENDLTVAAILSGNRNFEARIHQSVKANFLASPMLVVAFALAGRIDVDMTTEPVALDPNGNPVCLAELWPKSEEIKKLIRKHVRREFFSLEYGRIFDGDALWHKLPVKESTTFHWDPASTYIKKPPFFDGIRLEPSPAADVSNARALLLLGNSITTDHISPAGAFSEKYPAGRHLKEKKVAPADFNSYGSRRGNHEVMMRGTFANIRIKNKMVDPKEGGYTLKFPEKKEMFVYEAAVKYAKEAVPLVVLGGREYGGGSSRDWAAKGPNLLGIKAVIAESFERIHRSNLLGMGLLPLQFKPGQSWEKLGLEGSETFFISGVDNMTPRKKLQVKADGSEVQFDVIARLDTEVDIEYFLNGGILPYVLRKLMRENKTRSK